MFKFDQNFCAVRVKRYGCWIYLSILSAPPVKLNLMKNVECRLSVSALNLTLSGSG
jgi:hypothetical protein